MLEDAGIIRHRTHVLEIELGQVDPGAPTGFLAENEGAARGRAFAVRALETRDVLTRDGRPAHVATVFGRAPPERA